MTSILSKHIDLKQTSPNTYGVSWDAEYVVGKALLGGYVAAQIHHVTATHLITDPELVACNQPDILNLHLEFLRPSEPCMSTVTVTTLKLGAALSTIQLQLVQNGKIRVIAMATSANFDNSLGPTTPTMTKKAVGLSLHPPPGPKPDFDRVWAHQPDQNWIPGSLVGEITPVTSRILALYPRTGFTVDGICDIWNSFLGDERIDAAYLALMADIIPSMSDTLLGNDGLYNAHAFWQEMKTWAETNPGVPATMTNTVEEAMKSATFNVTVTMDLEFKRRLPRDGQRWIFVRTAADMLQDGRMGVGITICNEEMALLCAARQLIVVLDAKRRFAEKEAKPSL
ncbi:hypothetical protein TMatcc_003866 [Talaromyces marneffei ATCC 18224]|uniref:Thioesterase family protein n=2 Tax=Talaromyces marneffei TaxID=37727 RepID=B6Q1H1_TALMQ|nr:uncharacterized protein EYB26_001138 [Talaromyces marneffei]EEA27837.1 conserved hypothetical protein [Talaromyces marneffei ATCC 18224]KAE8556496.1 hypothetical protein EYB25_001197 [Talaromyces marneffei]QGA13488.1 hypothetical protein EYB26_001138 [Talaromyces marneffei]